MRDYRRAFEWCDRIAEFADRYGSFTEAANRGAPGGPAEYPHEYLLVVWRRAGTS